METSGLSGSTLNWTVEKVGGRAAYGGASSRRLESERSES